MFQLGNMMRLLATVAVCSDVQNFGNDLTTHYSVEIKKIKKAEFDGNKNAVSLYSRDKKNKMYFEIKEKYLLRKSGLNKEWEVELESCSFSKNPTNFNIKYFVIRKNKEIKFVSNLNGFVIEQNTIELEQCEVKDCFYNSTKVKLMFWKKDSQLEDVVLKKEENDRLIFIPNKHINGMFKVDVFEFEVPLTEFMNKLVVRMIDTNQNNDDNDKSLENEKSENKSNDDLSCGSTDEENNDEITGEEDNNEITGEENNDESAKKENINEITGEDDNNEITGEEVEKVTIESENKQNMGNTNKTTVTTNNSLKLTTKIVIGVVVPLICLCVFICAFIVYRRKRNNRQNTTTKTENSYHLV